MIFIFINSAPAKNRDLFNQYITRQNNNKVILNDYEKHKFILFRLIVKQNKKNENLNNIILMSL